MSVFKVCWDESKDKDALVVAGVIATLDQWDGFWPEWNRVMSAGRPLKYFKASDAYRLEDPDSVFFGWTQQEVEQKVRALAPVIAKHSTHLAAAYVTLGDGGFDKILAEAGIDGRYADPYYMGFAGSLKIIVEYMDKLPGEHPKPALFYDLVDKRMRTRARRIMDEHRAVPRFDRWLDDAQFCDDKKDPGLQAADLVAWHLRNAPKNRDLEKKDDPAFLTITEGKEIAWVCWGIDEVYKWRDALARYLVARKSDKSRFPGKG